MIDLVRNRDFYGIGVYLLLVILVGAQEIVSPSIGVFMLVVAAEGFFRRTLRFVFSPGLILFIGLYLLYLLGLLWSEHPAIGWKLLEYKMSFFIFPLLFMFRKTDGNYWRYLQGLVWGGLLLISRLLYHKLWLHSDLSYYDISRKELNLHPTYAAIYFAVAIIFLCWDWRRRNWGWHWGFAGGLSLLFAGFIVATGSFAGILFLGILVAAGVGYMIYRFFRRWALFAYLVAAPFLVYMAITRVDALAYDLEVIGQLRTEIGEGKTAFLEKNRQAISGSRERVMLWLISAEIIAEHPFGVGTGDIDFYLAEKCDQYDLAVLKEQNLNPHNQFLQIGIDLGWPGMIYLIFLLVWLMVKGIRSGSHTLVLLVCSLAFNALFESVLQRQSGIVFYTLVTAILLLAINENRKVTLHEPKK